MATYEYLDLNGLRKYDSLIKAYIADGDAKAIKFARIEDGYLKLYKAESPAVDAQPDFSLQLPVGDYIEKVIPAAAGNIATLNADGTMADGGVGISGLAAGSAVTIEQNGLVYTIKQGGSAAANIIGTINIPADMVVTAGVVETYEAGSLPPGVSEPGTYIKLTVANTANDKLYIKVTDLIDIYTAEGNAAQVQITIDNNNVISATIVEGSITRTELAQDVLDALDLAETAVQPSDITFITDEEIEALFGISPNVVEEGYEETEEELDP